VTVYEAAVFPGCPPVVKQIPLAALTGTDVTAASTIYIPPARPVSPDPRMTQLFGSVMGGGWGSG
jgi:hypothetical protein